MRAQLARIISGIAAQGRMGRRIPLAAVLASGFIAWLPGGVALAQEPNQVTGVAVEQADGFAQVSWEPVEGATDYELERTPVGADDVATGPAAIVGVWRPNRTVTPESPTLADSGFNPGDRFQWRVRARFGTTPQPFSAPVFATTSPQWGDPSVPGEGLRTQWESTQAAQFTSDVNEYDYTAALDAASDRVRVVEIGRTVLDRPINMLVIGYPKPPRTVRAVAESQSALVNCNVHGNEPSSREACLIMARELAFARDARTLDNLRKATVLIVPSINGDGRAANTRGNSTGQDLNRDYSLIRQPETFAFVEMMRDYRPEAAFDGHEFGNSRAGDLPVLPPRHLNVAQSIFDESQNLIEGWMYENGSADGWWFCPYGCEGGGAVGLSQETILRNTMGLKNVVGSLLEARSAGGPTRPNETNAPDNRRRKTYSALYTYQQFLDYFRANQPTIKKAIKSAIKFQTSNTGRIVFRGSRPIPARPAPHPGESPPPDEDPTPAQILDPAPCGYVLDETQHSGPRPDGRPAGERLAAHGIEVVRRKKQRDYLIPMSQPQRGLIPLLLDGQAAEPLVAGERVAC
ncbi:MAG: M14 family zinc carboxypeptidase [Solirubrobacteraceae bacterium]